MILDWEEVGLLLKYVEPKIQEILRQQSINKFEKFDPENKYRWGMHLDINSKTTLTVLRDAGLMNKDTYIKLYQKALNRNYSLRKFDSLAKTFISNKERKLAREEIDRMRATNTTTCLQTILPSNPDAR